MSQTYWHKFWREHGDRTRDADAQTQVLRTVQGRPVPETTIELLLAQVRALVGPTKECRVLDLCCGNGVLSEELARGAKEVLGVDLSPGLIASARERQASNLEFRCADVRALDFPPARFERILLYAGLQYFSEDEAVALLGRARGWMSETGVLVLGDVPDIGCRWKFFDSEVRRRGYFCSLQAGEPLIGTWFERAWIRYAGEFAGFASIEILDQKPSLPYAHFRFDARLRV
jgi:SAM-dependent methyltransferase